MVCIIIQANLLDLVYSHGLVRFSVCVCVCVCACACVRVCACVRACVCVLQSPAQVTPLRTSKIQATSFIDFNIWRRMVSLRKLHSVTLTYFWKLKNLTFLYLWNDKCVGDICRFWHLPWNGVIEKIALLDLNLLLEVKKFQIFISLKR